MSNIVVPKRLPDRFQSLSQKLLGPTGIAVLASLGIHAALAISLPYLGTSSQEKPAKRTVQLVQLTPEEQGRLPQMSPPPSLSASQLQSLKPLPGLSTPYPPLTSSGFPLNLSPVGPPSNGLANKTLSSLPSNTTRSKTTATIPSAAKKPQANKDKKITDQKLAPYQGSMRISPITQRPSAKELSSLVGSLSPAPPLTAMPPLPPPPLYPSETGGQPETPIAKAPQFGAPSSTPAPSGSRSRTPEPLVSPNITISTRTNNPDITKSPSQVLTGIKPASAPTTPLPPKPNGTENGTGTSNDDYNRRSIAALVNSGASDIKKYPAISGTYPKVACVEKLSGTTLITAQVDSQGTVSGTSVTLPSPSPVFDDVAEMAVSGINFGAKGKAIAYQVPVEFKYDSSVCGSATVPQTAKPENAATPQTRAPKTSPEPQNTATPQDAPAPKKSPE